MRPAASGKHIALTRHGHPDESGLRLDLEPAQNAQNTASVPVYPAVELEERLPDLDAKIAVLALPAEEAQEMLNRLYDLGIRAIWNFSPVDLYSPRDMAVANWHLYDSLQILSYRIKQMDEEKARW